MIENNIVPIDQNQENVNGINPIEFQQAMEQLRQETETFNQQKNSQINGLFCS